MIYQAWGPREHRFLINLLAQLLYALTNFGQTFNFATITLASIALDMIKNYLLLRKVTEIFDSLSSSVAESIVVEKNTIDFLGYAFDYLKEF